MNWNIATIMWLKGLGIFAVACLIVFPIGLFAFPLALMISWIAIPVYALLLWTVKKLKISHWLAMALMLTVATTASVTAALYLYKRIDDTDEYWSFDGVVFWIPLLCCILSVIFSNNSIYCYLNPESVSNEFATQ